MSIAYPASLVLSIVLAAVTVSKPIAGTKTDSASRVEGRTLNAGEPTVPLQGSFRLEHNILWGRCQTPSQRLWRAVLTSLRGH